MAKLLKKCLFLFPIIGIISCTGGGAGSSNVMQELRESQDRKTLENNQRLSEAEQLEVACKNGADKAIELYSQYDQTKDKKTLQMLLDITNDVHQKTLRAYELHRYQESFGKADLAFNLVSVKIKGFFERCSICDRTLLLSTADLFSRYDDKKIAKDLYRTLITTYIGDRYKGDVKKAEFGLEDLK